MSYGLLIFEGKCNKKILILKINQNVIKMFLWGKVLWKYSDRKNVSDNYIRMENQKHFCKYDYLEKDNM